ncbi:hypothetical protein F4803DRAFT_576652 [Xylaria telfairii]|nr:hypothetical protein F4803DRAFT_576652 [Xylaria telfairii]
MTQVTFAPRRRPPPIPLSRASVARAERSPYPRFSHQNSVPDSPPDSDSDSSVSSIDAERRVYYLNDKPRNDMVLEIVSNILKQSFPDSNATIELTYSFFTVDKKWELLRFSIKSPIHSVRKQVHAYRIYAKFQSGGPEIVELDRLEPLIRAQCDSCGMQDIVLEFVMEDRAVSAWYPPKPDKEKLQAFFGPNSPDSSDEEI